jgi:hypothetical protein
MSTGSPRPVEDEIARIEQQMAEVERTGPTLAELEQRVIAQLDEAARYYRAHGFEPGGVLSGERAHNDRLAMIGALVSVNRNELIAIEVARVRAAFDAAGARGTTEAQKAEQLAVLRGKLRAAHARRELEWRRREEAGEQVERTDADPEIFLTSTEGLTAIANGRSDR